MVQYFAKAQSYYKLAHSHFVRHAWPLVKWLRANPLGPAVTVCLAALFAVFLIPQLSLWLFAAPKLLLTQTVLAAPFVPYAVYRVHGVHWKPLAGLWAAIYILALARSPLPLKVMPAFKISQHMSGWFMWGFLFTAILGLYFVARMQPSAVKPAKHALDKAPPQAS